MNKDDKIIKDLKNIEKVYRTYLVDDVNDYLDQGWELLSVGSGNEEGEFVTVYVLGMPRKEVEFSI